MVVVAGRPSDFGQLLLDRRFPSRQETVRWLAPMRFFVPITAAGQCRIHTGFPFNKAKELCTYTD
jgi:hypothetical protein